MKKTNDLIGLSWPVMLGLAALTVPRIVLHDIRFGLGIPYLNSILALGPIAVWIGVALYKRVPRPIATLAVLGLMYGLTLAIVHQFFFSSLFDTVQPRLGGNLTGVFSPGMEMILMRVAIMISSLITGFVFGVMGGVVAEVIKAFLPKKYEKSV